MTLDELYDALGLKGPGPGLAGGDRSFEGILGQHILNVNAIRLQKERADKAPWIPDGPGATEIHQGNPEGNPDGPDGWGVIGLTWAGVEKVKEAQREACAKFIEEAASREVGLGLRRNLVHAERCRAAPLVK